MTETTPSMVDGLDEQKIRFIEVDGHRVRYYEDGFGDPLVLICGGEYGAAISLDAWSLNLKQLAQHFHVYALDKPGQGYSDIPRRDADYTWEWMFRLTYLSLRALGIHQAHFVGHSRGGLVVACLALEHPEMVKTAVIVDSSTVAAEDPHVPTDIFYNELAARTPGPPTRETTRMILGAQSVSQAHVTDDYVERTFKVASLPATQEARRAMKTLRTSIFYPSLYGKRSQVLSQIDDRGLPVPTLVVWGFNDRAAPLYLGHRLFERICPKTRHAEFHVINRTGHQCFREQWKTFNRVVIDFCRSGISQS